MTTSTSIRAGSPLDGVLVHFDDALQLLARHFKGAFRLAEGEAVRRHARGVEATPLQHAQQEKLASSWDISMYGARESVGIVKPSWNRPCGL
ncbi:hypothetical protein JBE04_09085 [Streptomyces sp. PRKS01-29]|nr:hypothetical protein [Streptomyces sabulosicollis]MBI0294623.1 hypothetical protein [Streptomyces sabulosicollis]